MRNIATRACPVLREDVQLLVRSLAAHNSSRAYLNLLYSALPRRQKARFHALCSRLFDDDKQHLEDGCWIVNFAGKRIVMPLTAEYDWQEWDAATAILGHDLEIKITYENLLRSCRPRLVFDVGANYGLHSLLFLAHGVRAISFEPNTNCHRYLRRVCEINGLACEIQAIALSDTKCSTELWFPDRQTWMGTTSARVLNSLAQQFPVISMQVEQTTIDDFVDFHRCRPDLIKIDTEGNELRVLRGSRRTLQSCRPIVIFESWREGREELNAAFREVGYRISSLPWRPGSRTTILDDRSFLEHCGCNFIAFAAEKPASGGSLL